MAESLEADVAVVGAGLAGLVAARRLVAAGKRPLVIEARERVGGRLLNEEIGDGKVVEVGGQWIGPTQDRIAALAAELGVGTFPTHDEGRHLIEMAGRRTSYTGALTDARLRLVRDLARAISPLAQADFEQARARLDRMAREVPLEEPWMAPKAAELGQPDLRHLGRPQHPHRHGPQPLRVGDRGSLGGRARRRLAPPRPLLHALRRAASTRCSGPGAALSRTASTAARSGWRC